MFSIQGAGSNGLKGSEGPPCMRPTEAMSEQGGRPVMHARTIDSVYHSTLGLGVIKKKRI